MSKVKIAFVCVNYKGFKYTSKMITSLQSQNGVNIDYELSIVVVDNSPTPDMEILELCNSIEHTQYLRSDENNGYFAGLNYGLRTLDVNLYDYIVVGNNDLEYESNFCSNLLSKHISDSTQVICPNVVTIDGIHQNPHHLNSLTRLEILAFDLYFSNYLTALLLLKVKQLYKILRKSNVSKKLDSKLQRGVINQGVGACYILTKHFFTKHQELFFPCFLYGEEATLSWQVRNSGGQLVFETDLLVEHAESASLSKLPAKSTYEFGRKSYWVIRKYLF